MKFNSDVKSMSDKDLSAKCAIEAMHLIIRDGCDPLAVHLALMKVRQYRAICSDDMPTTKNKDK
jgi:hypothetical protein